MDALETVKQSIRPALAGAGAALVGGLVFASPASASVNVIAAEYGIQGRGPSIAADLVALAAVAAGVLALVRARSGDGGGRTAGTAAVLLGLAGAVLAVAALLIADGGPGTGNGVVGSALALVIGPVGAVLGWRALRRGRRAA